MASQGFAVIEYSTAMVPESLVAWTDDSYEIKYEKETKYFYTAIVQNHLGFYGEEVESSDVPNLKDYSFVDITSNQKKILIRFGHGIHALLMEFLPKLVRISKQERDSLIVIDLKDVSSLPGQESLIDILKLFLQYSKINYLIVNSSDNNILKINNFCKLESSIVDNTKKMIALVKGIFKDIQRDLGLANKVVYLSRKLVPERPTRNIKAGLSSNKDIRVIDEHLLEDFFIKNGVEIVYPELFETAEDQINYFKDVKVLISATSSGIANAMFMSPGGLILELSTPFVLTVGDPAEQNGIEVLHHLYPSMCYKLDHNYISIPNDTRQALDIINKFNETKVLDYLFAFAGRQ